MLCDLDCDLEPNTGKKLVELDALRVADLGFGDGDEAGDLGRMTRRDELLDKVLGRL